MRISALALLLLVAVGSRSYADEPAPADVGPPPAPEPPAPPPPPSPPPPPPAPAPPPPAKPALDIDTTLFGRAQLIIGLDPQNQGDVPDTTVVPGGSLPKEWNASVQTNADLGGKFTYRRPIAGFIAAGQVTLVMFVRRIFTVTNAGFTLDNPEAGIKIGIGRFITPTVNVLPPGLFQFASSYGNLIHETSGAYVAKKQGKLLVQVGAGRPEADLFVAATAPTPSAAPPLPFVEGRVAYIDPEITGMLPSNSVTAARPGPLTLSLSGAYGKQRVGVGEKAAVSAISPMAVDPVLEDLTSWLVGAEACVPLGDLVIMGESYIGKGANVYVGAMRQRPHVDLTTGRHVALGSRGGWLQLSYALPERWMVVGFAGIEKVTSGLDFGVVVDGTPKITENRLLAVSFARNFENRLHAGVQVQHQATHYDGQPEGSMFSILLESSMDF